MEPDMLQLVYISSVTSGCQSKDIDDILYSARKSNSINRISGILLHDSKRFLQVLEGETGKVEETFARISKDKRHRAIVKLSERKITQREFGEWLMASYTVLEGEDNSAIIKQIDELVATVPDPVIRATFSGFVRIERKVA